MSDPNVPVTRERGGIGCLGLALFACVIFGILKVAGVLDITWLIVFAPALVTAGLTGIALLILLLILGASAIVVALRIRLRGDS